MFERPLFFMCTCGGVCVAYMGFVVVAIMYCTFKDRQSFQLFKYFVPFLSYIERENPNIF